MHLGVGDGRHPCSLERGLFCEEAWKGIAGRLGLVRRDVEIARCVLAGWSDKKIVSTLGLSWDTVQTHMKNLHRKLRIHSRVELATRVYDAYIAWRGELPTSPHKHILADRGNEDSSTDSGCRRLYYSSRGLK